MCAFVVDAPHSVRVKVWVAQCQVPPMLRPPLGVEAAFLIAPPASHKSALRRQPKPQKPFRGPADHQGDWLVPPEILEPVRRQGRVDRGSGD